MAMAMHRILEIPKPIEEEHVTVTEDVLFPGTVKAMGKFRKFLKELIKPFHEYRQGIFIIVS